MPGPRKIKTGIIEAMKIDLEKAKTPYETQKIFISGGCLQIEVLNDSIKQPYRNCGDIR
jgi:hypothetical protein